jgi:hypothetical protein
MFENKMIFKNSIFKSGYEIPFYISELEFENVIFEQFPKFPAGLKKLKINDCRTINLKPLDIKLNEQLEHLTFGLCSSIIMKSITRLPESLKYLELRKVWGDRLPELPEGLETLILTRDKFNHYPLKFPNSLKRLDLYESSWKSIPKFPKNLEFLDIWGIYAKHIPRLPNGYIMSDFFVYY